MTRAALRVRAGPLTVSPDGDSRVLRIDREDWNCRWAFQFPECIASDRAWFMDCQPCRVTWRRDGASLQYSWRMDDAFLAARSADAKGPFAHKQYRPGLAVQARLTPGPERIDLRLKLTNETDERMDGVECDGGCLQARSAAFHGPDERTRSFLRIDGRAVSLAALDRTIPERCLYAADPGLYDRPPYDEGEWFWGRSHARPDLPCHIGMASVDGAHAVAVVFEDAHACSANADDHHCLHSRPRFGALTPGHTVTRRGTILFGPDIDHVLEAGRIK